MSKRENKARWKAWLMDWSHSLTADIFGWPEDQPQRVAESRQDWRFRSVNCTAHRLEVVAAYRRDGLTRRARRHLRLARNGGALSHLRPDLP